MLEFLKFLSNRTFTENGAVTYRTTRSECLDLFASIGAMRSSDRKTVTDTFLRAYAEDPDLAMKILFYARDVRGGLGERSVFRTLIVWLAENEKQSLVRNLPLIAEYGRWDDLLVLLGTPAGPEAEAVLRTQFETDCRALETGAPVSLLGKWLPSVNASCRETVLQAKRLAKAFGLSESAYRKTVSALRAQLRILENSLRQSDYTFDYAKQPSQAMMKYRKAFIRNDGARYEAFLSDVKSGKAELHTGTMMPYQIAEAVHRSGMSEAERSALDVTWNALEDFTNDENALVVADGSGSMYCCSNPRPASVAQSLAVYFAERNHGAFHDHFITFSMTPQLVKIKGRDITEKIRHVASYNEIANTNLQAVFALILRAAVVNHVPQKDLPSTLYIISDMQFDACVEGTGLTNFENAKRMFRSCGYTLPRVVFWNVAARRSQQPVTMNEKGVALVSGFTARIFSQVMSGVMDPYANMINTIMTERYAPIAA